jgi:hypothetical protein
MRATGAVLGVDTPVLFGFFGAPFNYPLKCGQADPWVVGDSCAQMWIRPEFYRAARMPSTRSQPLNPRLVATLPAAAPSARTTPLPKPARPDPPVDAVEQAAEAARAGGFHESSYELRSGLEINESEWPPDTTIPGALSDR